MTMLPSVLIVCLFSVVVGAVKNDSDVNTTTTLSTSTTTTTTAPTTHVVPTPTVPVYDVYNGTDICLHLQMNLKMVISYFNQHGESLSKSFYLNASSNYVVSSTGLCQSDVEAIQISWWPEIKETIKPAWSIGFRFKRLSSDGDAGQFSLNQIAFNYTVTDTLFPETNETVTHFTMNNQSQFTTPIGSYFQCMAKQTWKLARNPDVPSNTTQPDVFLSISDFKVEAFRSGSSPTFVGTKNECSADFVPNKIVPIVVGVALAAMIVIALITFIIGSRRRQAGYQEI